MQDVIVIGAGTAGLTSAIYCLRAGKSVLVFEEKMYGGQIINTPDIENYPGLKNVSGYDFATSLYQQAKDLGMEYKNELVTKVESSELIKKVITDNGEYETKAVIIATGAKNRTLGIDNEEDFIGKGVSYCATCDGAFFKGKDVAVVGGGNTALEDSLFLSNYCNKVYLIHRRDEFRGDEKELKKLQEKPNVEFILNAVVEDIIGVNNIESIKVKNVLDESISMINVAGIFVAIGQVPDNERFQDLIELDEKGYIIAGEDCKTNEEGIFVAGDCRTKSVRQLVTAAGDGAVAALSACSID